MMIKVNNSNQIDELNSNTLKNVIYASNIKAKQIINIINT